MQTFFSLYGGALLSAFLITLFLLSAILFLQNRLPLKNFRHHTFSPLTRFGGWALMAGFLLALWQSEIVIFPTSWWIFFGALTLGLLFGVIDDFKNISWPWQLGIQISLLTTLYFGGIRIESLSFLNEGTLFIGFLAFLVWGILILNALNWLDGIDGLSGSIMAITFSSLFVLALSPTVYQPPIAILLAVALGATLAFLVYNFPPAKIIAGTAGSTFFGLIVIFVSVIAGTKIATILLVLTLPLVDALLVILKRAIEGRSLFTPDKGHLHHILQRANWSDRKIVFWYVLLTLVISSIALNTQDSQKFLALIFVFCIVTLIFSYFHFPKLFSRKVYLLLGSSIFVIFLFSFFTNGEKDAYQTKNVFVSGNWFQLDVAQTDSKRALGLSGRDGLCARCGMLFLFPESIIPGFWMKDMRFSIDILWVKKGVVVDKNENLPYPSLEIFAPYTAVDKVIELPAGSAHDISVGSKVIFW